MTEEILHKQASLHEVFKMSQPETVDAKEYIKSNEGFSLEPYADSLGNLTIGYGHKVLEGEDLNRKITQKEADDLFNNDFHKAKELYSYLGVSENLNKERETVLTDMIYNMGLGGVLQFKRMLSAIDLGDFNTAAAELLDSKYAQQVGPRATKNAELLLSGEVMDLEYVFNSNKEKN